MRYSFFGSECNRQTFCYYRAMKIISWSAEKNAKLRAERGVSFEDAVFHIVAGDIRDTFDHPNRERNPDQKVHVMAIEDDVYLMPFIESDEEVFLKTIIPSRKTTRQHGGNSNEQT